MSSDPVTRFLPTLEQLRSIDADIPPGAPQVTEPLAALIVHAALIRRTSWVEEVDMAPGFLQRGEPAVPDDYELRHHVRIDERLGSGICTGCMERPGYHRCRVCGGSGVVFHDQLCSCVNGWIACPTCGGRGQSERVRLRYYTDTPAFMREVYMPSHITQRPKLFHLKREMTEELGLSREIPEDFRCHDLSGEASGTAYRGGQRKVRPHFHGHHFGDAIDRALAGLAAMGTGASVVRHGIRAYAWPFLYMQWSPGLGVMVDKVAYVNRGGFLSVFGGTDYGGEIDI